MPIPTTTNHPTTYKGITAVYMPSTAATCVLPPLPANHGRADADASNILSNMVAAAQGAFDLSVYRPDLGPNGMPWGLSAIDFGFGKPALNIAWPGMGAGGPGPTGGTNPNPGTQPGTGPSDPGIDLGGTPSNPRVIATPFCTPLTTAQRYVAPPVLDVCGGVRTGNFTSSMAFATNPAQAGQTPVNVTPTNPGMGGWSGLGACSDPNNACAGNEQLTRPPGYGPSPAERARRGCCGNIPTWVWLAAGAAALYAVNRGGR